MVVNLQFFFVEYVSLCPDCNLIDFLYNFEGILISYLAVSLAH